MMVFCYLRVAELRLMSIDCGGLLVKDRVGAIRGGTGAAIGGIPEFRTAREFSNRARIETELSRAPHSLRWNVPCIRAELIRSLFHSKHSAKVTCFQSPYSVFRFAHSTSTS